MVNQLNWLSNLIIEKSVQKKNDFSELEQTYSGLDQKFMLVTTQNINYEEELKQYNTRFTQIQAEKEEAEQRVHIELEQVQQANNTIEEFRSVN